MIFHMSFGARDPQRVAHVLASLAGATALRAPTPPFPHGAWFVVFGDAHGSMLEILPATAVLDPEAPLGVGQRKATSEPVSAHVLIRSVVSAEVIDAVAQREGWRTQQVETGLFKVLKLWIDRNILVEFLTEPEAARYAAAFGAEGLPSLDGKLRDLEAKMATALAGKLPPHLTPREAANS